MAENKYAKHILKAPMKDIAHYTGHSILAHDGELNAACSIGYHCIAKPVNFDMTHSHNFAEMLCFIGGNPLDVSDFDSEIDICLGDEKEMTTVTVPTIISIPPNLPHCPINIRKVGKPFIFLEISLTSKYKPINAKKK